MATQFLGTATILDDEGTIELPQAVIDALDLKEGDWLRCRVEGAPDHPVLIVEKANGPEEGDDILDGAPSQG